MIRVLQMGITAGSGLCMQGLVLYCTLLISFASTATVVVDIREEPNWLEVRKLSNHLKSVRSCHDSVTFVTDRIAKIDAEVVNGIGRCRFCTWWCTRCWQPSQEKGIEGIPGLPVNSAFVLEFVCGSSGRDCGKKTLLVALSLSVTVLFKPANLASPNLSLRHSTQQLRKLVQVQRQRSLCTNLLLIKLRLQLIKLRR